MNERTSKNDYVRYYAATSEALAVDGYALNRPAPRRVGGGVQRPRVKKNASRPRSRAKKIVYRHVRSYEKHFSFRMVITLAMIFAGIILSTMSYASIKRSQLDISSMRTELVVLQEEEAGLRTQIAEEYDAVHIEKAATMRLNMSKPKAYQIVYINVPKQSYVVQYGAGMADEPDGVLGWIVGVMDNFGF